MRYASVELGRTGYEGEPGGIAAAERRLRDNILQAALMSDQITDAILFSDCGPIPEPTPALQELTERGRIKWNHLAEFPRTLESGTYVYVTSSFDAYSACELRESLGRRRFPICVYASSPVARMGRALSFGALRLDAHDAILISGGAPNAAAFREILSYTQDVLAIPASHVRVSIETVPVCVDTDLFRPRERGFCREALGLDQGKLIVLVSGQTCKARVTALEPVFAAAGSLSANTPELLLVIAEVTDPIRRAELDRLTKNHGLQERVSIMGEVPDHLRPLMYSAADVFLSLDTHLYPASGLTVIEALASAVPVVATDWNGTRELIEDGVNGMLVSTYWNGVAAAIMTWLSAGDAAEQFLSDRTVLDVRQLSLKLAALGQSRDLRERLADAARQRAAQGHSLATLGQKLVNTWGAQLKRVERAGQSANPPLDYSRAFAAFGTRQLELDTMVDINPRGRALSGNELVPGDLRHVPALLKPEVTRVLQVCSCGPVSIESCIDSTSPLSFEALIWLMQNGYVDSAVNQSVAELTM